MWAFGWTLLDSFRLSRSSLFRGCPGPATPGGKGRSGRLGIRLDESDSLYLIRKCPGLGGPGGKPSQAVVGIRLAWLSDFFFCRLLLCSESNAYAIGRLQRKMFYGSQRKLFQEQPLTRTNVFLSITSFSADALAMPERWARAST